jgi:DNA modification methylase
MVARKKSNYLKIKNISGSHREFILINVNDLIPWPDNPKDHSEEQIDRICRSYKSFGDVNPILIDEKGNILAGHGRYLATLKLGYKQIQVVRVTGLSLAQKNAYRIADNKIAQMSSWNKKKLKQELENLLLLDELEIEDTGFSTSEIDLLLDDTIEASTSENDELLHEDFSAPHVSRRGDVWIMGNHRLVCGDALKKATYELLMLDELAQLIVSDPPYNVGITGHVCGSGKVKHSEFAMASGEMSNEEFTSFLNKAFRRMAKVSKKNATAFYFMDWRHIREITDAALPIYGLHKQLCVWVKDNGGMGSFYRSRHELVFVFLKQGQKGINNFKLGQHGRYRTNVWEYPGVNTFSGKNYELLKLHPTVKPISMIADILRDCSHRNDIVLDAFSGSGTIILAAERTGRRARAIEYEPKYVDVALQRWIRETGISPILERTGETFEQVLERRSRVKEKKNG